MLKLPITYKDLFTGEEVTETFWFNLTRTEFIKFEVSYKAGFVESINRIIESNDREAIIAEFQKIILMAYGVRTEDGKGFEKSDELSLKFTQTAAYDELFVKLSTDDDYAAMFINGIVPKELLDAAKDQDKPQGPPPAPNGLVPLQTLAAPTPPINL
jgi:hypothetical protein